MQTHLEFRVVITGYMLVVLTLSTVTAVVTVQSVSATSANQTGIHTGSNMTFVGNMTQGKSMMMPGGDVTFGASLKNAKMHLLEAMRWDGYMHRAILASVVVYVILLVLAITLGAITEDRTRTPATVTQLVVSLFLPQIAFGFYASLSLSKD